MLKAKAAIFDTDGTLINTTKRFYKVFCSTLKERGQEAPDWNKFFENYSEDTLNEIIRTKNDDNREKSLHDFWLNFLKKYRTVPVPDDYLIEGADRVLKNISEAGGKIAVTTSCILPASGLRKELESYGLGNYVDTVITGEDGIDELTENHHFSKNKIFEIALETLDVAPKDSVIVGDYWNDIKTGKKLGAKTIAVLTGSLKLEILKELEPDEILESVDDLLSVVEFQPPDKTQNNVSI